MAQSILGHNFSSISIKAQQFLLFVKMTSEYVGLRQGIHIRSYAVSTNISEMP